MVMADSPEVIVVSSDDETDDNDVIFVGTRTTCVNTEPNNKENVSIFIKSSPDRKRDRASFKIDKASFKIDKAKLDSLKKMIGKNNVARKSNSSNKVRGKLQINKTRLKKLKAFLQVELKNYDSIRSSSGLKVQEKMELSQDSDLPTDHISNLFPSPAHRQALMKHHPPPSGHTSKLSSVQLPPNYQQSPLTSPIKIKSEFTNAGRQSLSSGWTTPVKHSPSLTQASIKTWCTPVKKSSRLTPVTSIDEKHVTAKRNEVVWPPSHVTLNSTEFISRLYESSRPFPSSYQDTIEGLQDELFLFQVVRTIQSFMSSCMAPSSDLIWFLVKDVLLKSCQRWLSFATYSLLNEIHARFPACCVAMHVDWKNIKDLTTQLTVSFTTGSELQVLNASLALLFILTILSSEVKFTALKTRTTRLSRYLSADFDSRNTKEIIAGIKVCLTNHTDPCDYGKSKVVCHSDSEVGTSTNYGICSLELFQSLLKFVTVCSSKNEQCSRRIAEELAWLYIDLPSLEQRILLLQTLKSHPVRRYLVQVLLMNYCRLGDKALPGNDMRMGAKKILFQDFVRCPPKRSSDYFSDIYIAEEVEEYVTLVAYLIQSYMATHAPGLQCAHGDSPLAEVDEASHFTPEDLTLFRDLKWHVLNLRKCCLDFIGGSAPRLSTRTELMLDMMAIWNDERGQKSGLLLH